MKHRSAILEIRSGSDAGAAQTKVAAVVGVLSSADDSRVTA